ncbi:penicillin-binding protein [Lactobacillus crispatus]|nr:penicillin-binding protein [Lactobacillus crispatus]
MDDKDLAHNQSNEFNSDQDNFYDELNSVLPKDAQFTPLKNSQDDEKNREEVYEDESDDSEEEYEYGENDDYEDESEEEYEDDPEDYVETRSQRTKHHPILNTFFQLFKWGFVLFGLVFLLGVGVFAYYASKAPNVTQRQLASGGSSTLYTNDGHVLLTLGQEKRYYLKYDEIPQTLKDAVVSIEDKRFWNEGLGIDPIRIVGSTVANIKGHDISAGGSSITQQLVKLSVFSTNASDRTLKRKAQEAWIAMHISRQYSREQILEYYINKVYMNYSLYGIGTASKYYYGKSPDKLDLAQTALLAGMPNAPTFYDPYTSPARARYRRNLVLQAMLSNGKITQAQYDRASTENVQSGLIYKHDTQSHLRKVDDPYIKEVVDEVRAKGYDPYNDNLRITVNINQKAQNKLYELANDNKIPFTDNKMQVGATVVDPNNGHVIAIIGGRHLPDVQLGLDRAVQTSRSTGSSIKPVLDYAPAIQYKHWSTAQILSDTPYIYRGTHIQLYDWDNRYYGNMTMRYALEQSRNVPAVRTLESVGILRASKFAKQMGVNVDVNMGLSVGIGANASSLQMAGAYSAFADNGIYHKPQFISKIETVTGDIRNYDTAGKRVMDESTAYMITDMLKGVITRGSGTKARIDDLIQAGKTGTVKYSDGEIKKHPSYEGTPKDSWFVGYTRSYVMSVWTGYDNLADGKIAGRGQDAAAIYYREMMSYLMNDKANIDWVKPSSVIVRKYATGDELYQEGHAPSESSVNHRNVNRIPRTIIRRYQRTPGYNFNQNQKNNSQGEQSNNQGNISNNNQRTTDRNNQPVRYYYYYR